jgi:hypothetical protein
MAKIQIIGVPQSNYVWVLRTNADESKSAMTVSDEFRLFL